jgi:hypothetical protein
MEKSGAESPAQGRVWACLLAFYWELCEFIEANRLHKKQANWFSINQISKKLHI